MPLYQSVTVAESRQVVLENLHYAPGERVDVVVLPQNPERAAVELQQFFERLQARPVSATITENTITEEIRNHRGGR
jgi:hypothetical protein